MEDDAELSQGRVVIGDIDNAPMSVPARGGTTPPAYQDIAERFTEVSEENFRLKAELERLRTRLRTGEILDSLIGPYASKAYWFMVSYAVIAGVILVD